jgi:hypothetical protein
MRLCLGLLCLLLTATTASAQSLEQQGICAKQAKVAFEDYKNDHPWKQMMVSYKNHYDTKLNKCFIAVESMHPVDEETLFSYVLMDAFEHKAYAHYILRWSNSDADVSSTTCVLIPTSQTQIRCSSKDECVAFVAKYMEE